MEKISRAKFARIGVEIDLSKQLKRGFWIGDKENRCMVAILYERLPVFCYKCGLVGHYELGCFLTQGSSVRDEDGGGMMVDDQYPHWQPM